MSSAFRAATPFGGTSTPALSLSWALLRHIADAGSRKVTYALARLEMMRVRRHPEAVIRALRHARSVLIVCHGNIIRSAFAAQLLRETLGPSARVSFASAGLEATPGRSPHPLALLLGATLRVDLRAHRATRLSEEHVRASDVIFAVDVPQLVATRQRFPDARQKTFLLASLAPWTPMEIDDPVNGDEPVFEVCFTHILHAVRPIARVLSQPHARQ